MLVCLLSRKAKKVVNVVNLLDCTGVTFGHRKMVPYIKELTVGDASKVTPKSLAAIYVRAVARVCLFV